MRVLLLSGGIESGALAYGLRPDVCLTIDYGQPSFEGEKKAAARMCKIWSLRHVIQKVILYRNTPNASEDSYWPLRNQALATVACASFFSEPDLEIIFGFVKDDIYPDCTNQFLDSLNSVISVQREGINVIAPGVDMGTVALLKLFDFPLEGLGITFSCHNADFPCGTCNGCEKNSRVCKDYKRSLTLKIVGD